MSKVTYLTNQILSTNIYLNPEELNGDINTILLNKLIDLYSGICINEGYIIKGSILIKNISLGKLKTINSESKIIYNVKYECNILFPNKGDIIECYIDNNNKMGIIAYIKLSEIYNDYEGENKISNSPFIIIIPNDNDNKDYEINKKIKIKVIATRIKYNSSNIQIVGEIV